MRKSILLLLTLLILILQTGCWSRIELNDVAIVTASAIDLAQDGKYKLSVQILKMKMTKGMSEKGGSSENATLIISAKGDTIMDALNVLQKKIPRQIIFSHNRVILVGEKLARAGIAPAIDFFSRHREARGNSYLLTTRGEAVELLKAPPNFEIFTGEEMREEEKARMLDSASIRDFIYRLLEKGIEPTSSQMQVVPLSDPNGKPMKEEELGLGLVGVGIYRKDKLIGWMNRSEAECLLWLRNRMKNSVLTVAVPGKDQSSGKVSVQLIQAKTKFKSKISGEKIQFEVTVKMTGELFENTTKLSIKEINNLNSIQHALEKEIENRVTMTINKLQKQFKSDAIGFGSILHRQHKSDWNKKIAARWEEEFPNIEVNTKAAFKLTGTGRANESIVDEEELEK
ncbi:Ger(x)C family spore germination protein [Paenibacillus sp. 1011MAR3C5]|uniref:Ger(x)C family spore germination protein n=1 Tax=Paenibacillus sp. 1011MAR3C5 TaxID=1675787 RepID=UPI000E6C5D9F|nr:Ger(x)C family spore germination protein [Paenibacillus sp. 1011MAR3C5]RJE90417.1 Ger(x)C family spore germination protein [Paenibacillus sp. 1011MAR3C5]